MINADGDAVFNNITARGAIKTAVFEYAEIQAVKDEEKRESRANL